MKIPSIRVRIYEAIMELAGSGFLGEASLNTKRKAIMVEIDGENIFKIQSRMKLPAVS